MIEPFVQSPPVLENLYTSDQLLVGFLRRKLPPEILAAIEAECRVLGAEAAGPLASLQQADRLN